MSTVGRLATSGLKLLRAQGREARRAGKRVGKRLQRAVEKASPAGVKRAGRLLTHVFDYHVEGELTACPACGAPRPQLLAPLPLERRERGFGFVSGCERCGVVFANPLPDAATVAEVYTADGEWGRHRQQEQEKAVTRKRLEYLFEPVAVRNGVGVAGAFDVTAPAPGAAVLDVGCGPGGLLDTLQGLGWRTYGIEPAMKQAFERHEELAEIPSTPLVDLAVLHHVLEHVTTPLDILRALGKAVKPGGLLLVSVPNLDDLPAHRELKYCIRGDVHVLSYSSQALAWLLAEAGFEVLSDRAGGPGTDRRRQRVVLARRAQAGHERQIARPSTPLSAARRALATFERGESTPGRLERMLPVRSRAALADLRRSEWRY